MIFAKSIHTKTAGRTRTKLHFFTVLALVLFFTARALASPPQPTAVLNSDQTITGTFASESDDVESLSIESVECFKGIPYADPPVGSLRFRHPAEYSGSYDGFKADNYGYSCPAPISGDTLEAFDKLFGISKYLPEFLKQEMPKTAALMTPMNEDCLTINVFRPANTVPTDDLPVMVWIFGGAFQFGGSSMYDGSVYVRESLKMSQPVILVSFNYRLGALGFLGGSAVQEEQSGNPGFMDQRLALKWVAKHIKAFGGDPGRVTLFGQSAGAMSILAHMTAHDGDNSYNGIPLFAGAIMQSGAVIPTEYVDDPYPEEMFWRFATAVDCYQEDPTRDGIDDVALGSKTLECLRNVSYEEIMQVQKSFVEDDKYGMIDAFFGWGLRSDRRIHSAPIHELISEGKFAKIPYITGNQQDEGTMFGFAFNATTGSETRDMLNRLFRRATPRQVGEILSLYPDNRFVGAPFHTGFQNAVTPQFKRISAVITDLIFQSGRRLFLKHTDVGATPVYVYHASTLHQVVPALGTFHSSDLIWQWRMNVDPAKAYRRYFIAFANYGNPNAGVGGDLPYWARYTREQKETLGLGISRYNWLKLQTSQQTMRPLGAFRMQDTYRGDEIDYLVQNYGAVTV